MKRFKRLLVLMPILLLTSCLQPSVSSASSSSNKSVSSSGSAASFSTNTSSDFSTDSSSAPVSAGYKLVSSSSDIVAGYSYLIGDASNGSVHFVGSSSSSSYYLSSSSLTVSGPISTLPTSIQAFTLGGSSGSYTFKGTVSLTNYLAGNTNYPDDLLMSSSNNTWDVAVDSGVVTLKNTATNAYVSYASDTTDWRCSSSSASLYLYYKEGTVTPTSGAYRVAPKTSTATTLNVYSVTQSGSSYAATVTKTLTKGSYYTTYEDVAAYWIGFGELPVNYVLATSSTKDTKKSEAYAKYGEAARLWFAYHLTSGYMNQVPSYNTYGDGANAATYYEFDISSDWTSYSGNRGALRLMAMPYGLTQYGVMPVIFYTRDHYASFSEYYNYSGGWGKYFADQSSYKAPTTVSVTY